MTERETRLLDTANMQIAELHKLRSTGRQDVPQLHTSEGRGFEPRYTRTGVRARAEAEYDVHHDRQGKAAGVGADVVRARG
jgi:hypothetical protein